MSQSLKHLLRRSGLVLLVAVGVWSCSTKKNTSSARFYHQLTTRYNVYFHGKNAYDEAYKNLVTNHQESYSDPLVTDPIWVRAGDAQNKKSGGAFDKSLEKGKKAIRYHSIRSKPVGGKKNSTFYNRLEFNPFLYNAWFLVGKSQFYNADFLEAMATFSYTARLYASQPAIRDEARLWQARCYIYLGWTEDSKRILSTLQHLSGKRPKASIYPLVLLEQSIATSNNTEALSTIRDAIRREPLKLQRSRLRYLYGQLLREESLQSQAKEQFNRVIGAAPPYPLEFAARLQRIGIDAKQRPSRAVQQLKSMAKNDKNKELLDAIYLAMGRIYLQKPDTTQAIRAFGEGVEKSTAKQHNYLYCNLELGDIFLAQKNYLAAQKAWAGAATVITKEHKRYEEVQTRSAQLDELAKHAQVVAEQDSLRALALLPESKRLAIIDSAILAYKKQQKELDREATMEAERERQEQFNQSVDARGSDGRLRQTTPPRQPVGGDEKFYFYNPQLVSQGKVAFERKWGKRALEDDWRRRAKKLDAQASRPQEGEEGAAESAPEENGADDQTTNQLDSIQDPTHRAYYLAQIPFTEEQKAHSDELIQKALEEMAELFNTKMELFEDAIYTYKDLLRRYPQYEERLSVYYSLFMLYHRLGKPQEANEWLRKMQAQFPEDDLTLAASQPRYIEQLKENIGKEQQLYVQAFDAYMAGKPQEVHRVYDHFKSQYPMSVLMPKLAFLDGLSYVLSGQGDLFHKRLSELVKQYPKEEITPLAQDILTQLLAGRRLSRSGYTGLNRDYIFASDSLAAGIDSLVFSKPLRYAPHSVLLLYPKGSMEKNSLVYAVSAFNFSHFTQFTLDAIHTEQPMAEEICVKTFPSATSAWRYVKEAYAPSGYMEALPEEAVLLAMDENNLSLFRKGMPLEQYMQLVADSIVTQYPAAGALLSRWHQIQALQEMEEPALDSQEEPAEKHSDFATIPQDSARIVAQEAVGKYTDSITIPQDSIRIVMPEETRQESAPDTLLPEIRILDRKVTTAEVITPQEVREAEKARIRAEKEEQRAKEEAKKAKELSRKEQLKEQQRKRDERKRLLRQQRLEKERQRKAELKQRKQERREREQQLERERRARLQNKRKASRTQTAPRAKVQTDVAPNAVAPEPVVAPAAPSRVKPQLQ